MKALVSALFLLAFLPSVFACSEAGPQDPKLVSSIPKACVAKARAYAQSFGDTMIKLDKTKGGQGPQKGLVHESTVLYLADKGVIGYNVSTKSKDGWECNFCVSLRMNDGNCYAESVSKHMCAK